MLITCRQPENYLSDDILQDVWVNKKYILWSSAVQWGVNGILDTKEKLANLQDRKHFCE